MESTSRPLPHFDQDRFRRLVDALDHVVVWEFDETFGRYTFVSQHSMLVLGFPCEEWMANPHFLQERLLDDNRPKLEELLNKLRHDLEVNDLRLEHRLSKSDGTVIWAHSGVHREIEGGHMFLRGVTVDINSIKMAEERERQARAVAEQAVSARDEVLAVVSHDLRNPLGSIRLAAAVIGGGAKDVSRSLQTIERSVKQMEALINDLVDAAAIRSRGLKLSRTTLDTGTFVPQLVEDFRNAFAEKELQLTHEIRAHVSLSCDPSRILQVVSNLLNNALKFTEPGGTVKLTVSADDLEATFSVQDSGRGIIAEELDKIFEREWQSEETAHLGSGMGLYIAKGIVEAHSGRIWVKSETGQGTTIAFTLPVR